MVAGRGQGVREAPKSALKTEAFDAFCELTCCTSFQNVPNDPFEVPQASPKPPRSLNMASIFKQFQHSKQQRNHTSGLYDRSFR